MLSSFINVLQFPCTRKNIGHHLDVLFWMFNFQTFFVAFRTNFRPNFWTNLLSRNIVELWKFLPTKHKLDGNNICENDSFTPPTRIHRDEKIRQTLICPDGRYNVFVPNYSRLPITQTFGENWKRFELSRIKLYRKWPDRKRKLLRVSGRFELLKGSRYRG